MGKNDLKKKDWLFWLFYHWLKHDDLSQNLFLEVKKPEIKETRGTFIIPKLKSSYWGPFSGLKSQDLIKTSRTFSGVIFCPRSFWFFWILKISKSLCAQVYLFFLIFISGLKWGVPPGGGYGCQGGLLFFVGAFGG